MKKITAILKNCKMVDRLFSIRERQIYNALENAKTSAEEKIANAQIDYGNRLKELSEKDADYKSIINDMLKAKQVEINGKATLEAIDAIVADLNSEVEVEDEATESRK